MIRVTPARLPRLLLNGLLVVCLGPLASCAADDTQPGADVSGDGVMVGDTPTSDAAHDTLDGVDTNSLDCAALTDCDGLCVDTRSSVEHCGGCGLVCETGQYCGSGACRETTVSFATDVKPIFEARCASCHSVITHNKWVERTSSCGGRTHIVPGDADASFLVDKLEGTQACGGRMPQGSPLPTDQIGLVRTWIDEGALDN